MKICLVTPYRVSPDANPGWHMITAGIRWLLRKVVPISEFSYVTMFDWGPESTRVAEASDMLVLCGNPRYDLGRQDWLYRGLIDAMSTVGKPMVDAWGGAGAPRGGFLEADVAALSRNPRNRDIAERLQTFRAVITRDRRAQRVNESLGVGSVELPCSSWWAAREYGVCRVSADRRDTDILVASRHPGDGAAVRQVRELARHREVISTQGCDQEWCEGIGVDSTLIYEPRQLLELYARCRSVVSYRLHASIPAASLGAEVFNVAIDSRAQACDAFGLPWSRDGEVNCLAAVEPIDPIPALRKLLC